MIATNISTKRVPGVYVEVDNSNAINGLSASVTNTLFLAQKIASGTAKSEELIQVFSSDDAKIKFGAGSQLADMLDSYFANNDSTQTYVIPLDDDIAATASTATITVSGTATKNGTLELYITSRKIKTSISSAYTAEDTATALNTAINADKDCPFTATVDGGVITLTAKNKGSISNNLVMKIETQVEGISLAFVQAEGGAGDPNLQNAIAVLPDEKFDIICIPYTDESNLLVLKTELGRRWGNSVMLDGHVITAKSGTVGDLTTVGNALNDEHLTVFDAQYNSITPFYKIASACAGQMSSSISSDPARQFKTLELSSIIAPVASARRTMAERETLLYTGIATLTVSKAGNVTIDRAITTYRENALGAPDSSYLDSTTLFTLSYLRETFVDRMLLRYPRHKLANDGDILPPGQPIATPKIIRAEIIALAGEWVEKGLIENLDKFQDKLLVERDLDDRERVNILLPPDLINNLRVIATLLQFTL
jgi:phage tail sheath gpL-like